MINETWRPVVSGGERVIMCECGDESCYKALVVTDHGDQIIEIYADWSDKCEPDFKLFDMPEGYSVCERVEESRYPELDASVAAGEELEHWKERCHRLEARLADFAQELHRQTMLAEYRKVLINESKAETARLRALLPDAETRRAGDRLGAIVTNTVITPDDYSDLTMIRKWLNKLDEAPAKP